QESAPLSSELPAVETPATGENQAPVPAGDAPAETSTELNAEAQTLAPAPAPDSSAASIDGAALQQQLAERDATIADLQGQLAEERAQLDALRSEGATAAARLQDATEERIAFKAAMDQAEIELARVKSQLAELEEARAAREAASTPDPVTQDFAGTFTKEKSCALAHARANEPVFVLRGQDPLSGPIVRMWAASARLNGVAAEKADQALLVADELDAWPRKKLPD
ncbi:MAG: hypothetical protein JNG90_19540, partial [Planctomycetaceae bacterium]|nr:hypothetical protein [Planctomycetaceae bacterium]